MIGAIENAIVAQLKAAADAGALGYEWRTLETYPDDFDTYLKDKVALRTPAAWAVFLGLGDGYDDGDGAGWHGVARFALVVASQSLRNETATRHGGATPADEPGSYQLAEDATRILSRNDLGLDLVQPVTVTGMRLVARSAEMRTHKLSLMALELRCTMPIGLFVGEGNEGDFTQLHVDWDVPSLGNVEPPLPAAIHDAEDLIEVPQ